MSDGKLLQDSAVMIEAFANGGGNGPATRQKTVVRTVPLGKVESRVYLGLVDLYERSDRRMLKVKECQKVVRAHSRAANTGVMLHGLMKKGVLAQGEGKGRNKYRIPIVDVRITVDGEVVWPRQATSVPVEPASVTGGVTEKQSKCLEAFRHLTSVTGMRAIAGPEAASEVKSRGITQYPYPVFDQLVKHGRLRVVGGTPRSRTHPTVYEVVEVQSQDDQSAGAQARPAESQLPDQAEASPHLRTIEEVRAEIASARKDMESLKARLAELEFVEQNYAKLMNVLRT